MAVKSTARFDGFLLAVLLFAQLLLMAGSVRHGGGASLLESGVGRATAPVVGVARTVSGGIGDAADAIREIRVAKEENVRLKTTVGRLEAELERARERLEENARLRRLLGMREELVPKSVVGRVVAASLSGQSRVLVIDLGADSGIRTDLPVVAWGGALGRVVAVGPRHAKVRLLSDPSSGVAGVVQRSRAEGMILGRGADLLEMAYVPKYADVAVGDRIVTSGLDGVFPRGFGLGKVAEIGEPTGASLSIRVEPEIDFGGVEEVLVLLERPDLSLLTPVEPEGEKP